MKRRKRVFLFVFVLIIALSLVPEILAYDVPAGTLVYVTPKGKKYHREDCTYLTSAKSMTIAAAESKGYTPCSRCNPDILTGEYVSTWDGHSGGNGKTSAATSSPRPLSTPSPLPEEKEGINLTMIWLITAVVLLVISIRQTIKKEEAKNSLRQANSELYRTKKELNCTAEKLQRSEEKLESVMLKLRKSEKKYKQLWWTHKYDGVEVSKAFSLPVDFTVTDEGVPHALYDPYLNLSVFQNNSGVYHLRSCSHVSLINTQEKKIWEIKSGQPCKACKPPVYDFSWYERYKTIVYSIEKDGLSFAIVNGKINISEKQENTGT